MSDDAGYVASFLRDADRDRYFATLLLKEPERRAIQSLYAFSADAASIRDRAREPTAGEIRLQWWADALKGVGHGNVRQNPLAAALLDAISRYGLPSGPLLGWWRPGASTSTRTRCLTWRASRAMPARQSRCSTSSPPWC
jgi:phytoene synthase